MSNLEVREIPGMFEGPVRTLLIKLSLPMFAGMFVQVLYNVTDTFWVSRIDLLDPSYMGGTAIVFPLIFFFMALGNGLMVGTSSLVARAIGEKNTKILSTTAESGFVIAFILSSFSLAIVLPFSGQILKILGAEGDYYKHALEYLRYIIPAGPAILFGYVLFGILQGEGMMKYVMNGMVIGTVLNIVLDPVFIFVLKLDVRGAAIATVLAQFISVLYVFTVFLRNKSSIHIKWKLSNIKAGTMREIMSVGLPQSAALIIMSLSFVFFNRIVISIDKLALTAFALCGRFEQLMLMPAFSIGAAVVTIVGQNSGRGNFSRVRETMKQAWIVGLIAVGTLTALMVGFAPWIFRPFTDVDKVLWYAVTQYRFLAVSYIAALVGIIGRSFFQALGYPLPALLLTLLRLIILALPAMLLMVYVLHMGIYGVWLGLLAGSLITMGIAFTWIQRTIIKLEKGLIKVHKV